MFQRRQSKSMLQKASPLYHTCQPKLFVDWLMTKGDCVVEISGRGFLGLSQRWHICSFGL